MSWLAPKALAAALARRLRPIAALAGILIVSAAISTLEPVRAQQPETFTPRDEAPEDFAPGPGREEAFYACTACHGFRLVAQQGLNRHQWEESIDLMTEKHGMPALEGEDRKLVLDYLAAAYPPRTPGGSPNPFLSR